MWSTWQTNWHDQHYTERHPSTATGGLLLTRMRLHYSLSCPAILWLTVTFNPGFRTHDLTLHKTTRLKIAGHNLLDETTHSKSHGHTAEGEREGGGRARLSRTKVTQLLTTPDTPLGQSKKTTWHSAFTVKHYIIKPQKHHYALICITIL